MRRIKIGKKRKEKIKKKKKKKILKHTEEGHSFTTHPTGPRVFFTFPPTAIAFLIFFFRR